MNMTQLTLLLLTFNSSPLWFQLLFWGMLFTCVGSFLNVIIYRIPIGPQTRATGKKFNINTPASHCPICKHTLRWYENIPLLSWIIQKAKCRNCQTHIPVQYPLVEATIGLIGILTGVLTPQWNIVLASLFSCMCLTPALWWAYHKTSWNTSMLIWCTSTLVIALLFYGA